MYHRENIHHSNNHVKNISESKKNRVDVALNLPVLASYNLRSLFPKVRNFVTDILERSIDCAFLSEIWENAENYNHKFEIERMLELEGLKYVSCSRPPNKRNISYGGTAVVVSLDSMS